MPVKVASRSMFTLSFSDFCPRGRVVVASDSDLVCVCLFLSQKRKLLKQEGLLSLTEQCAACETWNVHLSYWGLVPLGPNFTGTESSSFLFLLSLSVLSHVFGAVDKTSSLVFQHTVKYAISSSSSSSTAKMLTPFCKNQSYLSLCRLCYNFAAGSFYTTRLCSRLLMCFVEISAKNGKCGYLNPILGNLRVTHDLGYGSLIELFSLSVTILELWGEMCTARLFSQGIGLFALKILPGRGRPPSTTLGIRKLGTLGYPVVKNTSFCIPLCWHNNWVWQTDE